MSEEAAWGRWRVAWHVFFYLLLEAATESLATGRAVDRHIAQALRSARDSLAESRRVVWALRPRPLA
ncbi:MAG TPA: histidine kinase, partial [Actinomycetes bacterium]|nr:histidine kinase [Actinomycetes bacterium]